MSQIMMCVAEGAVSAQNRWSLSSLDTSRVLKAGLPHNWEFYVLQPPLPTWNWAFDLYVIRLLGLGLSIRLLLVGFFQLKDLSLGLRRCLFPARGS